VAEVDTGTPWQEAVLCVVDLETTGLDYDRDRILSYGLVDVEGGRVNLASADYGLVRTTGGIPAKTVVVHGIRPADVRAAPSLDEGVDVLHARLAGRVLVAHAAWIEYGFLTRQFARRRLGFAGPVIDTAELSRRYLGIADRSVSPALEGLAERLGLPVHTPHHALGDAITTAQVFIAVAAHLSSESPQTVGSLATPVPDLRTSRRPAVRHPALSRAHVGRRP
jgi:DNA polymerase III subunit epsilon